ncbi:MAG: TerB family tellurite resistance protein [Bacteroidaceae bacterium]|nr:TerB family tellurite resistance protein [Bacteroidaceae bacterium]
MSIKELYLKAAFCCMACDGNIAEEEVNLIKEKTEKSSLFDGIDIEKTLNGYIDSINVLGGSFLNSFIKELKSSELNEEEELNVVKTAIEMIEADNTIEYSEVKYFKRLRSALSISDDAILAVLPDKEDYLLPDINQNDFEFIQNVTFAAISIPA